MLYSEGMDRRGSNMPMWFLCISLVLAAGVGTLYWLRPLSSRQQTAEKTPPASREGGDERAGTEPGTKPAVKPEDGKTGTPSLPGIDNLPPGERPAPAVDPAVAAGDADPAALVQKVGQALEKGDVDAVLRLAGKDVLPAEEVARLRELLKDSGVKLRGPNAVREVGELKWNELSRWSLETTGPDGKEQQIFLDLRKKDGRWVIEKVTLPAVDGAPPRAERDSMGVADAFLMAALRQDFERARALVDGKKVSDAKIAGLCILFEEGHYRLRPQRPLRVVFERPDLAGFLANVEVADGTQAAQFALNLGRDSATEPWVVREVNLDQLLADYARRVAGGDVYYTPLVANPQGGDTLVLYFEFDEDKLTGRTERQLEIVAQILRADPGKKLTISGHTDGLGGPDYNQALSSRRAVTVRDFLVSAGVDAAQIVTVAKGLSEPRRPNTREDGSDNPEGRRANRRTEIYLDF